MNTNVTLEQVKVQEFIHYVITEITNPIVSSSSKIGPLFGLTTDYVKNLSEEDIELLGSEDAVLVEGREAVDKKIKNLEEVARIVEDALKNIRDMK